MKLRAFVIDDEQCMRDTLRWHLEGKGHEVITAQEPHACVIYHGCDCNEPQPCADVLFIDHQMPNMTGLEFIQYMHERGCKGNPANKNIISGNTAAIDMDQVKQIGCNVLPKPLTLETVDEIIEEITKRTPPDRKLTDIDILTAKAALYRPSPLPTD